MSSQLIYPFSFGDRGQSDLLGGKGANLAEMVRIGLPVPPGFTITTEACQQFLATGEVPKGLEGEIDSSLKAQAKNKVVNDQLKSPVLYTITRGT